MILVIKLIIYKEWMFLSVLWYFVMYIIVDKLFWVWVYISNYYYYYSNCNYFNFSIKFEGIWEVVVVIVLVDFFFGDK